MSDLEIMIREIIDNYKKHGEPIDLAIKDVAREFGLSIEQVNLYAERLLGEESDGSLQFKDEYVRKRFIGE